MSHKTSVVTNKPWRFDLLTEATGVAHDYEHHKQIWLHVPYSDESESIRTVSLQHDAGLQSQVLNSLFLDRRAEPDDPGYAETQHDLRGWVGDGFFIEADHWGSKNWLLKFIGTISGELNDPLLKWAKIWTEQALQWMVTDGLCDRIAVTTWYPTHEKLRIHVELYQNDNLIYRDTWEAFLDEIRNSNT